MILNPLTTQIKLYLGIAFLVLMTTGLGYTHYSAYKAGQESTKGQQYEALKKALIEQEKNFRDQREAELRDAAQTAKRLLANEQRKIQTLERLNEALKNQPKDVGYCPADAPVNPNVILVLNDTRGGGDEETTPDS